MSFDIQLIHFQQGKIAPFQTGAIEKAIAPYVQNREPKSNFFALKFSDGEADLYGTDNLDEGFTVNHVSGNEAWDVLFMIAKENRLTIIAPGCPVIVTANDDLAHLPNELGLEKRVVKSGLEIQQTIRDS